MGAMLECHPQSRVRNHPAGLMTPPCLTRWEQSQDALGVVARVEGSLQDPGREDDAILGRQVVGIDGLWGHTPSAGGKMGCIRQLFSECSPLLKEPVWGFPPRAMLGSALLCLGYEKPGASLKEATSEASIHELWLSLVTGDGLA